MTRQNLPKWVEIEAEKKPRRKPGPKPSPKDMPKAKPAKPQKIHVRIELAGSVELTLEGEQAKELKKVLRTGNLDEILDYLDPWASGIEVQQETRAVETPAVPGTSYWTCKISEQGGVVDSQYSPCVLGDPFIYRLGVDSPIGIDWRQLA